MAGLKFQSFGAATMPLSKIVIDTDLDITPYNATLGDVIAGDITAGNINTTDIQCRDILSRKIEPDVVATASNTIKQTFANPGPKIGTAWQTVMTIPIPDGYLAGASVRVKFNLKALVGGTFLAYGRVVVGSYISPEHSANETPVAISEDVSIGDDPIQIQGRGSLGGYYYEITDIAIACDETPGVILKPITWSV